MKNIKLVKLDKYKDATKFESVSNGIYKALEDYEDRIVKKGEYVTAFSFELEEELNETEDRQYPLEDLLDEYLAHVSDFIQDEMDNPIMILELCTQKWLDKMNELIKIEGKHIYNKEFTENGEAFTKLVIE